MNQGTESIDKLGLATTLKGHHAFSPDSPEDETVCRYWVARGAIEEDRRHVCQSYQPKGSPVWVRNCMYCGWIDGEDLAEQIRQLGVKIQEHPAVPKDTVYAVGSCSCGHPVAQHGGGGCLAIWTLAEPPGLVVTCKCSTPVSRLVSKLNITEEK